MTDQIELTEFEEMDREQTSASRASGPILFRLSTDPFVNAGAAELTRQLDDDLVDIQRSSVTIVDETAVDRVTEQLRSIIREGLPATHRRKAVGHEINQVLDDLGAGPGGDRRIPRSQEAFPRSHGDEQPFPRG